MEVVQVRLRRGEAGERRPVRVERVALQADAEEDGVEFAERNAETDRGPLVHQLVVAVFVRGVRTRRRVVHADRARDAVLREVRVGGGQRQRTVVLAGVDLHAQEVARAEHVFLRDAEGQRDLFRARVAGAQLQRAGGLFGHVDGQIDLVGRARHFLGLDVHFGEEAQAVHAVTRDLDLVAVVPRGFELAELAADHFVARLVVAADRHAAHVHAARGLGLQRERDAVVHAVDVRTRLHAGEGVAEGAEVVAEGLGGLRDLLAVVGLAGLDRDERLELVVAAQVVAVELDARHHELLAFGDVHRDAQVLAVRRNGDLGRIDAELEVAARDVVALQRLEVGVELGARVLVRLGVPAHEAAAVLVEQAQQRRFAEGLVADHVHFADAGGLAFGHGERQVHAVALDGRDGGHDVRVVQAAAHVLALELLLGTVGQCLVVRAAVGQTDFTQRLLQRRLVEFLGADEVDVGDRGPLFDDDHQHVAVDVDPDVLEQPQVEQRADRGRAAFVAVGVAHTQGQRPEDRAGLDALQAFDADIAHRERLDGPSGRGRQRAGHHRGNATQAKATEVCVHL
ncbi:hypothetical protein D9M68_483840 [compost metagenome]